MIYGVQRTIARPVVARGPALHHGRPVEVWLRPAPPGHGRVFVRADLPGAPALPAWAPLAADGRLATRLGAGPAGVLTVEHLLAAAVGEGVDNLRVDVHGPELPLLDGAADQWARLLEQAGPVEQAQPREPLVLDRVVRVEDGPRWAQAEPCPRLELRVSIDFPQPAVGAQAVQLALGPGVFRRELAWARTFGFLDELAQLRAARLGLGGDLDSVVVFGPAGPLEPLRAPDEPVRHKALDLLGDLALLGRPLCARVRAHRPGHALTRALVLALIDAAAAAAREAG